MHSMPTAYYLPPHPTTLRASRFRAFLRVLTMTGTFLLLSTIAVFYSLGFKLNLASHSIQQTGIIVLDGPAAVIHPDIYLDGKKLADQLPSRFTYVFPGQYTVSIRKPGFQSWDYLIHVLPNQVISLRNIVLIESNPASITVPEGSVSLPSTSAQDGVSIRGYNELWVDDLFVTRFSQDVVAAVRYPDGIHVVCQLANQLVLIDTQSKVSQNIITLPSSFPVHIIFKQNGRQLYYQQDGPVYALQLY